MKWDEKVVAAGFSVISNTILVLAKMIIGAVTGSITIVSEALHSGVDLLASLIAFFSVRVVRKPADEEHPFGHGKVENVSGFVEALLILFAAVFIIHEAIGKLIHGAEVEKIDLGVLVMALATGANILVSIYLFRVARKTGSLALEADAEHLRTDVYSSIGVMVSLIIIYFTGLTVIDPVVAILVAIYIGVIAVQLTMKTVKDLMDARLSESEEKVIKEVLESVPEILDYHRLRTRRSGNDRFIDFHAIVSGRLDVTESHELADVVEKKIETAIKGSNVTIHIEPCLGNCPDCPHPCPDEKKEVIARQRTVTPGTDEVVQQVHDEISAVSGVIGAHNIHVHRYDGKWEVQIDLLVPPHMMVEEGHEIAEKVESAIRAARGDLGEVTIHVEPEEARGDDSAVSMEAQLKAQVGTVLSAMSEVVRIDDIHIHPLDGKWELHLDLVVPPDINVAEGHEIAEKVKNTLKCASHELGKISVHIEPDGHVDQPI